MAGPTPADRDSRLREVGYYSDAGTETARCRPRPVQAHCAGPGFSRPSWGCRDRRERVQRLVPTVHARAPPGDTDRSSGRRHRYAHAGEAGCPAPISTGGNVMLKAAVCSVGATSALLILVAVPAQAGSNHTIWVEPGTGTISAAVDRADPGDTLRLKVGTYRDSVSIEKTLTIKGSGWRTVLVPPDTRPLNKCNVVAEQQGGTPGAEGSSDVFVGHFRPGSSSSSPPRVSMAMAMR